MWVLGINIFAESIWIPRLQGIGQGLKARFFVQGRSHQGLAIHFTTRCQWQFLMPHKEVRHHLAGLPRQDEGPRPVGFLKYFGG